MFNLELCSVLFCYLYRCFYKSQINTSEFLHRNKSRQNVNRPNGNVNNFNHQAEYNKHYCDLTNNVPNVTGQEYDIIDSNYNTIDDDRSQPSNNVVVMEGDYTSVEPDGHLTTTMN